MRGRNKLQGRLRLGVEFLRGTEGKLVSWGELAKVVCGEDNEQNRKFVKGLAMGMRDKLIDVGLGLIVDTKGRGCMLTDGGWDTLKEVHKSDKTAKTHFMRRNKKLKGVDLLKFSEQERLIVKDLLYQYDLHTASALLHNEKIEEIEDKLGQMFGKK